MPAPLSTELLIIGSGPAGLTAAIYAARARLYPIVIEGDKPGGQLIGTSTVENWPGSVSILGPTLMLEMRRHAESFGTRFISGNVTAVDFKQHPFLTTLTDQTSVQSLAIIIATGANPLRLNCPGETTYWGKGVTTCAVCDGAFYQDKPVVVVGGGDSGVDSALFLKRFTNKITLVQRGPILTAAPILQEKLLNDPAITILFSSTIAEIAGDGQQVTGVTIRESTTQAKRSLSCDGIFINIGLSPNTLPFRDQLSCDNQGYIIVNHETATSVPGVFAAGDVHDIRYRQAITAAGAGCKAALDAEKYLKTLEPEALQKK